jgi:hypothetical protein
VAALSGWNGVWAADGVNAVDRGIGGQFGGSQDYKLAGFLAPWNEEGWARMAAMLRLATTPTLKLPIWGFPMMMDSFAEFKFVISPGETAIINQEREVRSIYTDGRGHAPDDELWPTSWGDSVGCWEGDTLVIDTIAVRYDPVLSAFAPPLSEQAHFVERLRLVAPGRIENEMTVTDPKYLTEPWTVRVSYVPAGIDRLVQDAFDDRIDSSALTIAPKREEFRAPPLPKGFDLTEAQLDQFVGRYALEGAPLEFVFERRGDRLYFQPPGLSGFIPMIATGPVEFAPVAGGTFRFIADDSGGISGFEGVPPDGPPIKGRRKAT